MKNIWEKMNRKVVISIAVVGVLVVALVASAFAFEWFKKEKQEVKPVQKVSKGQEVKKQDEQVKLSPEAERALRNADYAYRMAVRKIRSYQEEYGNFVFPELIKEEGKQFCSTMLEDFIEGNGIEVIEPTVQTDDFYGKKLKPYWNKCPKLKGLNVHDLRQSGIHKSHFGYRLYDIDFDNDNKKPNCNVFYEAGLYPEYGPKARFYDSYKIIDFTKCKVYGQKYVSRAVDFEVSDKSVKDDWSGLLIYKNIKPETVKPTKSVNGVIKYKNEYYIYEFYQISENRPDVVQLYFIKWEPYFVKTWNKEINVKKKCLFYSN